MNDEKDFSTSTNVSENTIIGINGIGKRIKDIRGSTPLQTFAEQLMVHKNTLRRYESEESYPDAQLLYLLSEIGNVKTEWLLTGKEPKYENKRKHDIKTQINPDLLAGCIKAVDEVLKDQNKSFSTELRSKVIAFVYDLEIEHIKNGDKNHVIDIKKVSKTINLAS